MQTRNGLSALSAIVMAALAWPAAANAGEYATGDSVVYDFFGHYVRRSDHIWPGAGDAKAVNTVTHMIDPWPRYSAHRHIPGDGERMVGAVERYRDVRKLPQAPPPIAPIAISPSGLSGTGSAGSTATK